MDEFKKKYSGEIELQVEEIPGDQAYVDKIKVLAASSDLPDVVEGKNGLNDLLIKGNLATPLNDYLEADTSWKDEVGADAINLTHEKGKFGLLPTVRSLSDISTTRSYSIKQE